MPIRQSPFTNLERKKFGSYGQKFFFFFLRSKTKVGHIKCTGTTVFLTTRCLEKNVGTQSIVPQFYPDSIEVEAI